MPRFITQPSQIYFSYLTFAFPYLLNSKTKVIHQRSIHSTSSPQVMQGQPHIRTENANDKAAIYRVHLEAFAQSQEAKLVDALRDSPAFVPELSLVAQWNEQVVGHLLLTRIQIISKEGVQTPSLALAPIAVLPKWQHLGIGALLIEHGLRTAKALGHGSVVVLGHPDYYPKFGFVPAAQFSIAAPFTVPDEAFMALELQAGSLKNVQGTVHYSPAFDQV